MGDYPRYTLVVGKTHKGRSTEHPMVIHNRHDSYICLRTVTDHEQEFEVFSAKKVWKLSEVGRDTTYSVTIPYSIFVQKTPEARKERIFRSIYHKHLTAAPVPLALHEEVEECEKLEDGLSRLGETERIAYKDHNWLNGEFFRYFAADHYQDGHIAQIKLSHVPDYDKDEIRLKFHSLAIHVPWGNHAEVMFPYHSLHELAFHNRLVRLAYDIVDAHHDHWICGVTKAERMRLADEQYEAEQSEAEDVGDEQDEAEDQEVGDEQEEEAEEDEIGDSQEDYIAEEGIEYDFGIGSEARDPIAASVKSVAKKIASPFRSAGKAVRGAASKVAKSSAVKAVRSAASSAGRKVASGARKVSGAATSAARAVRDSRAVKAVGSGIGSAKAAVSKRYDSVKTSVGKRFDAAKTSVSKRFDSAKTSVSNRFNAAKTSVGNRITSAKTAVSTKVGGFRDTVRDRYTAAKTSVRGKIDSIRGKKVNSSAAAIGAPKNTASYIVADKYKNVQGGGIKGTSSSEAPRNQAPRKALPAKPAAKAADAANADASKPAPDAQRQAPPKALPQKPAAKPSADSSQAKQSSAPPRRVGDTRPAASASKAQSVSPPSDADKYAKLLAENPPASSAPLSSKPMPAAPKAQPSPAAPAAASKAQPSRSGVTVTNTSSGASKVSATRTKEDGTSKTVTTKVRADGTTKTTTTKTAADGSVIGSKKMDTRQQKAQAAADKKTAKDEKKASKDQKKASKDDKPGRLDRFKDKVKSATSGSGSGDSSQGASEASQGGGGGGGGGVTDAPQAASGSGGTGRVDTRAERLANAQDRNAPAPINPDGQNFGAPTNALGGAPARDSARPQGLSDRDGDGIPDRLDNRDNRFSQRPAGPGYGPYFTTDAAATAFLATALIASSQRPLIIYDTYGQPLPLSQQPNLRATPNGIMVVGPDGRMMPLQVQGQTPVAAPTPSMPMPVATPPPSAAPTPPPQADDDDAAPNIGDELTADQDTMRRESLATEILGRHARTFGPTSSGAEKRLKERLRAIKRPFLAKKIIGQYIDWLKTDAGFQAPTAKAA